MNTSTNRVSFDRVMVDLNTQCDFLLPRGALPVTNRAAALPQIRRLMNWARVERVPVISSLEAHRSGESGKGLPPHCIDHTRGQRKLPFTLMPRRIVLHGDNTLDVPLDPFRRYQQVILTKREIDFLSNPKTDRLINTIDSDYWIIFGVTASSCVKAMVLGLLARQNHVVVAKDACGYWSETEGEHAFRMMSAKGAILATTDEIINGVACDWVAERRLEAARRELRRLKQASSGEDMSDSDVSHEMGVPVTDGAFGGRRRAKPRNGKRNDLTSDLLPTDLLKGRRASNRRATKH